jgi:hypothetical protein
MNISYNGLFMMYVMLEIRIWGNSIVKFRLINSNCVLIAGVKSVTSRKQQRQGARQVNPVFERYTGAPTRSGIVSRFLSARSIKNFSNVSLTAAQINALESETFGVGGLTVNSFAFRFCRESTVCWVSPLFKSPPSDPIRAVAVPRFTYYLKRLMTRLTESLCKRMG